MAQRSARREARSRAEADAGHRKRALLPFPDRETKRAFAISHGKRFAQRSARREARLRAEADAGHRKRALLPFPARETKRAFSTQSPILLLYIISSKQPGWPPGCLLFLIYKPEPLYYNEVKNHRRNPNLVHLIEVVYRFLWGDWFVLPIAGGVGISLMVVLLLTAGCFSPCAPGCCRSACSGI